MTTTESKYWTRKTVETCAALGLNKNKPAEFKLAYDIAVINNLGK